jgi:hypothetical protein
MHVPFAKRILPLLLALIWAPLAVHCHLETLTGWALLGCETVSHTQDSPAHCEDETCMDVESGLYQLPSDQIHLTPVFLEISTPVLQIFACEHEGAVLQSEPPSVFLRPWQFVFRAALPSRAPSLLS